MEEDKTPVALAEEAAPAVEAAPVEEAAAVNVSAMEEDGVAAAGGMSCERIGH